MRPGRSNTGEIHSDKQASTPSTGENDMIRAALATVLLGLTITACSSGGDAAPAPNTTATSTSSSSAPTSEPATTAPATSESTPAPPVAAADPFEQYAKIVGPLEPTLTKAQLREKYTTAVKMFCPGGLEQMRSLKNLASNPPGATAEKAKVANEKAAKSLGALWEFGCGKGYDQGLYTPLPVTVAQKAPWPCEPGFPNCTKQQSDKYVSQLEFAECQKNPAMRWDIATQTCKTK